MSRLKASLRCQFTLSQTVKVLYWNFCATCFSSRPKTLRSSYDRCFKKAHFASSNFRSKLGRFRESLEDLHPVLNKTPIERASDHDLDHLQATLIECRSIVRGCESFVDLFDALYRDRDAAEERQAGPPVWQDKELSKLRRDIDHRIDASLLRRLISVLYVTRRFPFFLCTFSLLGLTFL